MCVINCCNANNKWMKYCVNIIYCGSYRWRVCNEIKWNEIIDNVFAYEDDYNWGVGCCNWE